MKLSPEEIDSYVSGRERWPQTGVGVNEVTRLTRDAAKMISARYLYAILERTRLGSLQADSSWGARVGSLD